MSNENRGSQRKNPSPRLTEAAVLEMLPAYVLGALEADEMLAVDDYLAAHPALLVRLAELEATADQLALAAPEVEPPARAKAGLMARVQADAEVRSMLSTMEAQPARTVSPPLAPTQPAREQPRPAPPRPIQRAEEAQSWIDRLRGFLGGNFYWPTLAAGSMAAPLIVAVYAAQAGNSARGCCQESPC